MANKKPKVSPQKIAARNSKLKKRLKDQFATGLLTRGEAVPEPSEGADLPPGATHTYTTEEGPLSPPSGLRRRRFSLL